MNSGSVDLIATDPPFNKSRDFHATPDSLAAGASFQDRWSWERDVHQDWVDQITDDPPRVMNVVQGSRSSYGDGMGAFLCFMGVRLLAMHRVLKDTGSIYLHCDPTASHYLKELMDAVFGRRNFRNEIVWCYTQGGRPKDDFPNKHDIILRYSKSGKYTLNSRDIRVPYELVSAKSEDSFTKVDEDGRRYKEVYGSDRKKKHRYYKDEGKTPYDWWTDVPQITVRSSVSKKQKTLDIQHKNPSPFTNASSRRAVTAVMWCLIPSVAVRLRLWPLNALIASGSGIDIWSKAHHTVIQRLQREGLAAGGDSAEMLAFGDIHYLTEPPERTDSGDEAVASLRVQGSDE